MSLAKTAFNILYCMAGCDGVLDERECEIVVDFIDRHGTYLGRMDFEPQQAVSEITARGEDERGKFFFSELESLKFFTGASVRLAMLDAAAEIAATDGTISDGEKSLFQTMAANWEINLPDFVERRTAEANAPFEKNARENFYSWSLGRQMALDALALLRFDDGRIEPHFQPLVAATRQAADYKTLKQTILDFDREVYEFLCGRLRE
ncbi:MAG: TerB family tellurite resistance protein [Pyrinomonadaceae bacterium]|nr:TerB family tellurite resistance protein [Pyrinomonadaceae bacterium]